VSEILHRLPEFIGNHPFLSFGFIGVLAAIIATEVGRLTRGYKALTPAGLTQLVNRNNALLIDVSSIQDYEKGHVPGARHVAMSQFDPESKDLAKARELPIAIYCKSGQTSATAAKRLKKAGFSDVYTLDGGLRSWMEAQLPLVKGRSAS
jgi:rhodanese-related sulfurtransferase